MGFEIRTLDYILFQNTYCSVERPFNVFHKVKWSPIPEASTGEQLHPVPRHFEVGQPVLFLTVTYPGLMKWVERRCCILDFFERSRNPIQGSEFSSSIAFNMDICLSMTISILHCILDFERSRNQIQGSEFSSSIAFNMDICLSITISILHCILDFERSRNQIKGSEFFLGKWML